MWFNEHVVRNLWRSPRPDAAVVYHEIWQDPDGVVIRMDQHDCTLRRWIKPHHLLSDPDWFPIMLGITNRLANAHEAGLVHMDLKPTNSSPRSQEGQLMISSINRSHNRLRLYP